MAFEFKSKKTEFVVKQADVYRNFDSAWFDTVEVYITIEKKHTDCPGLDQCTAVITMQANKDENPRKFYGARVKREDSIDLYTLRHEDKLKNSIVDAFLKRLHKRLSNYEGFIGYGTGVCTLDLLHRALESMGVRMVEK